MNDLLQHNLSLHSFLERQSKGDATFDTDFGFVDPNCRLTRRELYGDSNDPGAYFAMRHGHDVIRQVAEFRRDLLATRQYRFLPRNDSRQAKVAAETLEVVFEQMPYCSLPEFVADVGDRIFTYGHSLHEIVVLDSGPYYGAITLLPIYPDSIYRFRPNDDYTAFSSVDLWATASMTSIDSFKLAWFGNQVRVGNVWGMADLRSILMLYQSLEQDMMAYLGERRLQKGILYMQENENGTSSNSWDVATAFFRSFFSGRNSPLLLDKGLDLKHLQASSPAMQHAVAMIAQYDQKIRAALDDHLSTLGVNGVGSLALGKEVAVKDRRQMHNALDQLCQNISGQTSPMSDLFGRILEVLGIDPTLSPLLTVEDSQSEEAEVDVDGLLKMLDAGVLSPEDLAPHKALLLRRAGIPLP